MVHWVSRVIVLWRNVNRSISSLPSILSLPLYLCFDASIFSILSIFSMFLMLSMPSILLVYQYSSMPVMLSMRWMLCFSFLSRLILLATTLHPHSRGDRRIDIDTAKPGRAWASYPPGHPGKQMNATEWGPRFDPLVPHPASSCLSLSTCSDPGPCQTVMYNTYRIWQCLEKMIAGSEVIGADRW